MLFYFSHGEAVALVLSLKRVPGLMIHNFCQMEYVALCGFGLSLKGWMSITSTNRKHIVIYMLLLFCIPFSWLKSMLACPLYFLCVLSESTQLKMNCEISEQWCAGLL